ncbi:MAG: hypothetical protein JKX76_02060 [Colwellia sp.]|nr:hypothetical protein [Colwellia sp.]
MLEVEIDQTTVQLERAIEWMEEFYIHPFTSLPKYKDYLRECGLVTILRKHRSEFLKPLIVDDHDNTVFESFLRFEFDDIIQENLETSADSPYHTPNPYPCSYDEVEFGRSHFPDLEPGDELYARIRKGGYEPTEGDDLLTDDDYQTLLRQEAYFNEVSSDCPESDPVWGLIQKFNRDILIGNFLVMNSMNDLLHRRMCEILDDQPGEVVARLMKTHPNTRINHIISVMYY